MTVQGEQAYEGPGRRIDHDGLLDGRLEKDERGRWIVTRHADAVFVATSSDLFSSAVSRFLQVPNGLDGGAHRAHRAMLDSFFSADRMEALRPVVGRIADDMVGSVAVGETCDAVSDLGARFAVRAQSAWLGWPAGLEDDLLSWMQENQSASRSGDLTRTAAVAEGFNVIIRRLLISRRESPYPPRDVTTELSGLRGMDGSPLSEDVIVSVLRNWTGGDLGSIALCVGVVLHWLATHPALQDELAEAQDSEVDLAIDEMLRIDDPFVFSRRVATCPVRLGGRSIEPGDKVVINWAAANRDPRTFGDPDAYHPHRNAEANLVYGIGPHACPGRPLATMELRVLIRAILSRRRLLLDPHRRPERARPPLGGFSAVPIVLAEL